MATLYKSGGVLTAGAWCNATRQRRQQRQIMKIRRILPVCAQARQRLRHGRAIVRGAVLAYTLIKEVDYAKRRAGRESGSATTETQDAH
ncbi:MAG: hypothetical protein ACJ8HI_17650 [Massilia sp.]